jgi:hypothetical protein
MTRLTLAAGYAAAIGNATLGAAAPTIAQIPSTVPTAQDEKELSIIFGQIDANRNGRLTKVEMSAYGVRRGLGTLVRPEGWRHLDSNGDGTLTREEFIVGMVSARAAMRANAKN